MEGGAANAALPPRPSHVTQHDDTEDVEKDRQINAEYFKRQRRRL